MGTCFVDMFGKQMSGNSVCNSSTMLFFFFQEDLSRLRRKLEKQKKVEVYTDADEILQEEINQYKVRIGFSKIIFM